MKKILRIVLLCISSLILLLVLSFIGLIIYSNIAYRPTTDRYITGRIFADYLYLQDSRFTFYTYDERGNQIRNEELNIYSWNKFNIEFTQEEDFFYIYRSSYQYNDGEYIAQAYIDSNPHPNEILAVADFNKMTFKYSIKKDELQLK